jgi:hypothetical protein
MATDKELHELLGRAVADAEFRAKLIEDPEKTVKEAGYHLTDEQLAGLKESDLSDFSDALEERLSKGGWMPD